LQTFDENLKWKWTKTHVGSLLLVLSVTMFYVWNGAKLWLQTHLPFLFFPSTVFENLLNHALKQALLVSLSSGPVSDNWSLFIVDLVFQLCMYLNIII
jgi:hypothetical protein